MNPQLIEILASALIAVLGSGGIVAALLHYNRDEAARVIAQHGSILEDMRDLYETMKVERDELHSEVIRLRTTEADLRAEVGKLRQEIAMLRKAMRVYTND